MEENHKNENKNPDRSKLRGIFNLASSNITASSGVLNPARNKISLLIPGVFS